jgi:hypothetical protein
VTTIPIKQIVLDLVHQMAENYAMQDGCKITSKSGTSLQEWMMRVNM